MTDEERIIAGLSDPELILWHGKFGVARLSNKQRARVRDLLSGISRELPSPNVFRLASSASREREADRQLETIYAA